MTQRSKDLELELQQEQEQQRQQVKVEKRPRNQTVEKSTLKAHPVALAGNRVQPSKKPDQGGRGAVETSPPLPAKVPTLSGKVRNQPSLDARLALRPEEDATALGVSEKTFRRWRRDEGLPYFRIDGVVLIPRGPLERWMAERMTMRQTTDQIVDAILEEL